MKLIHAADIHLGSKMDSRFPAEIAAKRKEELRNTFLRMAELRRRDRALPPYCSRGTCSTPTCPSKRTRTFFTAW